MGIGWLTGNVEKTKPYYDELQHKYVTHREWTDFSVSLYGDATQATG